MTPLTGPRLHIVWLHCVNPFAPHLLAALDCAMHSHGAAQAGAAVVVVTSCAYSVDSWAVAAPAGLHTTTISPRIKTIPGYRSSITLYHTPPCNPGRGPGCIMEDEKP